MFRFCKSTEPTFTTNTTVSSDGSTSICYHYSKKDIVYNKPQYQKTKSEYYSWVQKHKYR